MKGKLFSHRGFMLDSARHFIPAEDIRKILSAARICGMNRMHWHLTDDQGWRIEIRKYPRLTETGSVRGKSFFGGTSGTENNCGFYTREEVGEIVRFAKENGIEVIPEIELPGHASAMLAAYPEYGCRRTAFGKDGTCQDTEPWKYAVEVSGGIFPNLICAGKKETILFIEDILDELMTLFPYRMIHIGGDEALKLHWRRCPDCRRKMLSCSLDSEDGLQRDLVLQIGEYLAEKGCQTIVWNDVLDGGMLPPYFVVQQWTGGEEKIRQFMKEGGKVICSDIRAFYYDYPYGSIDVKKIWQYPQIPDWAAAYEDNLLGFECPLWTERVTNLERASFLLFPRMAAAGLKAQPGNGLPWEEFLNQVKAVQRQIRELGLNGAPEEYWDMPEDKAREDIQAEHNRIFAPEALPYEQKEQKLTMLEKTERFMLRIGIPESIALRAGDRSMAEAYGEKTEEEDNGTGTLARQMTEAVESREYGAWKRIPEEIWLDTMRCFPRFISEYRRSYGEDGFDRGNWTVRQVGCRLFRIGELEYELLEENGKRTVSLHIPSDARLEAENLNDSVRRAETFFGNYFPEWKNLPIICESWLLSPVLKELLPPGTRIRRFQEAFDLTEEDPDDISALEWVFYVAGGQQHSVNYTGLPENTSLQRKLKALLLNGRKPGNARGTLARAFQPAGTAVAGTD